ncbi:ATP-dependent RNA helicase dhx29, partial [Haematococcus lacustris]
AKVGGSVVLRDVSVVSSLATMLFSVDMDVHHTTRTVLVNNWLQVQCAPATAAVVKALKAELDNLLDTKVKSPHKHAERNNMVILAIVRALSGVQA